jgi:hypothetical protein
VHASVIKHACLGSVSQATWQEVDVIVEEEDTITPMNVVSYLGGNYDTPAHWDETAGQHSHVDALVS